MALLTGDPKMIKIKLFIGGELGFDGGKEA